MRRLTLSLLLLLLLIITGCTATDPGFVSVTNEPNVKIVDADGDIITIDENTKALVIVSQEHHEIHEGFSFSAWYEQDVSDTGDQSIIAFKTPDSDRKLNIVVLFHASTSADGSLLEAPTITDDAGASLAIYNRDRSSTETSTVIDTSQNPDVAGQAMFFTEGTQGNVTGGTEIGHVHLEAGEGKKAIGGNARGQQEWILNPDTLYVFVLESLSDADNTHHLEINWYEHTVSD